MIKYRRELPTHCKGHEYVGDREQEGCEPADPFPLE